MTMLYGLQIHLGFLLQNLHGWLLRKTSLLLLGVMLFGLKAMSLDGHLLNGWFGMVDSIQRIDFYGGGLMWVIAVPFVMEVRSLMLICFLNVASRLVFGAQFWANV